MQFELELLALKLKRSFRFELPFESALEFTRLVLEVDGEMATVQFNLQLELLLGRLGQQLRVAGLEVADEQLLKVRVDLPLINAEGRVAKLDCRTEYLSKDISPTIVSPGILEVV